MDVVYVYKRGPKNGIELRYSLRSLKNIKHDKVYIVGEKPDRIKNVIHIPVEDKPGEKYKNVLNKLYKICENDDISDEFIYMHDDNYIMKPINEIRYYRRGKIKQICENIKERIGETRFYEAMRGIYELFPDGYCYDVHTPIVFNRLKLRAVLVLYGEHIGSKRSIYCNYYNVNGKKLESGKEDIKIYDTNKNLYIRKGQMFLSTDNHIMSDKKVTTLLHELFPEPSRYEKPIPKKTEQDIQKEIHQNKISDIRERIKMYRSKNLK